MREVKFLAVLLLEEEQGATFIEEEGKLEVGKRAERLNKDTYFYYSALKNIKEKSS